jgi:hypothetical protein
MVAVVAPTTDIFSADDLAKYGFLVYRVTSVNALIVNVSFVVRVDK